MSIRINDKIEIKLTELKWNEVEQCYVRDIYIIINKNTDIEVKRMLIENFDDEDTLKFKMSYYPTIDKKSDLNDNRWYLAQYIRDLNDFNIEYTKQVLHNVYYKTIIDYVGAYLNEKLKISRKLKEKDDFIFSLFIYSYFLCGWIMASINKFNNKYFIITWIIMVIIGIVYSIKYRDKQVKIN